ncbi:MAG: hypothetical protein IT337_12905 [Thermomicrobiales bacterium]|nr:hypothetical protein [Thermomicrobiales bacterium]
MTDPDRLPEAPHERLVAAPGERRERSLRPGWSALAGMLVLVLALAAGIFVWRAMTPASAPPPTVPDLDTVVLAMPAEGFANPDGPWVRIEVAPVRPGANDIAIWLTDLSGADAAPPASGSVSVAPLTAEGAATAVAAQPGDDGRLIATISIAEPGWQQISAEVELADGHRVAAPFYLVAPDPNVTGFADIVIPKSDPAAEAVYERGLAALTSLHRVRYWQLIADGRGVAALSDHAIDDGSGGKEPSFYFRAEGGLEAVIIGPRRWVRQPGEEWVEQEASPMILPSEWGAEYAGATGFRLGRIENVDGEPSRVVTFIVPERQNPYVVPAWYAWWVGAESGELRREVMVSRYHYMINEFHDIDAPLQIAPPIPTGAGSPAATPVEDAASS